MAQISKGRSVKGPYKPICPDCAMYFSTTAYEWFSVFHFFPAKKFTISPFESFGGSSQRDHPKTWVVIFLVVDDENNTYLLVN